MVCGLWSVMYAHRRYWNRCDVMYCIVVIVVVQSDAQAHSPGLLFSVAIVYLLWCVDQ